MEAGPSSQAASVLGLLADLSPSSQQRASALTVPLDWFRWLPAFAVTLLQPPPLLALDSMGSDRRGAQLPRGVPLDRRAGERLAALDRIRPGEQHSLRAGFLFIAGRRPLGDGRMQRVFFPLLSVPVQVALPPLLGHALVTAAGDVVVTELVSDPARRHELEASYEVGGGGLDDVQTAEIPPALLRRMDRLRQFRHQSRPGGRLRDVRPAPRHVGT